MTIENPFGNYKNAHLGQSAILYGSGPSIMDFKTNKNVVKVGLNEQIYLDINLDYWFMGDTFPRNPAKFINCFDDYNNYKPNITKFIRYQLWGERGRMPLGMKHSTYYTCNLGGIPNECLFEKDISQGPLMGVASISFEALQFMLYAGFKNIYLVGHDCDYSFGTFRTEIDHKSEGVLVLRYWKLVKDWISVHYPDVKIHCINPVALKIFQEASEADIIENE
tara:strand:- start:557 stop:1222 length:666 start_codon:yes stop_codon:yes gene_type:complete